jgi:cytochrome c-type biogenesis protein CcmH
MPDLFRHPRFRKSPRLRLMPPGGTGLVGLALLIAAPALADTPLPPAAMADTQLPDPHQEAEARALMETLRCVVCQGQSIAQSDADMAGQMRALVRQRIAAGETPGEIRTWLIARYGDYITYDPPWNWVTAPLWLMPLVLLIAGIWIARASFKRRKRGRG